MFFRNETVGTVLAESPTEREHRKILFLDITTSTIERAKELRKLSTDKYRELRKKRNAVEGIPSDLRRKYHVDKIPVRGYLRVKAWFTMKIGAINAKRVIAKILSPSPISP